MKQANQADNTPQVLIVGAGPTGLTAAVELARYGIIADLVEKRSEASNLSRAVGILPESMQILEPSGVAAAIREESIGIEEVIFHQGAKEFARISLKDQGEFIIPDFTALAQDRTEAHLLAAFERYGGHVRYGEKLLHLSQDETGVAVQLAKGERNDSAQYDYVIGADGVRSAVRESLGVAFDGYELDGKWSIADVNCTDWNDIKAFNIFLLSEGRVVILIPLESARFRVISNTEDSLADLPVPMDISKVRRAAAFPISVRQVEHYSVGRVFLAGDAAHCHSPAGGRGMNLGIADAADLAKRMAFGGLEDYHASRHSKGSQTIAFSERGRKVVTSKNKLFRFMFVNTVKMVTRLSFIRKKVASNFLHMES